MEVNFKVKEKEFVILLYINHKQRTVNKNISIIDTNKQPTICEFYYIFFGFIRFFISFHGLSILEPRHFQFFDSNETTLM